MKGQKTSLNNSNNTGLRFYASQEEQEISRLKGALARSDEEKFYFLMNLIKLQSTLSSGEVIYKTAKNESF